jgi:hypothetical protein
MAPSVTSTAPAALKIIGGLGAYANVGAHGGDLTWSSKDGTVLTLNDGWRVAAPKAATMMKFSSSNAQVTPAKGPYPLGSSVLYT